MKKRTLLIAIPVLLAACSSEPEAQDPSSMQTTYTPTGYYQGGYTDPSYTQPGYTQPAATTTATAPASTATTPAAAGGLAIPCQADSGCGSHRCNTATQTCAFPCASAEHCQPGYACTMGVCLPGGTTQ